MDDNSEHIDRRPERDVGVKYITIAGKQIEAKYEICRKRVDIYGLHTSGNRRNGTENRRPAKNVNSVRSNRSDGIRNIGHKRHLNERQNTSLDSINNSNNNSFDSKESSVNGSVKSLSKETKTEKFIRKLEHNNNNGLTKNKLALEQVAKKLKKDKEPVRVTNRFNTLLSSNTSEDFSELMDKFSAKKTKKKKNKLSVDLLDNKTDDNSHQNVIFDAIDSNVVSSDSVPQMSDSLTFTPKSDNSFEANNNDLSNYFEKSDDNLSKFNENKVDDEMALNFKIYKNPILQNGNLLVREFSDATKLDFSDNSDDVKWQHSFNNDTDLKVEKSSHSNGVNDHTIDVTKNKSEVFTNAVLTHRHKSTKDNKQRVSSIQKQVTEVTNVSVVDQKSSAVKWALLLVAFLVFIVIYTSVILNTFCVCN